MGAEVQPFGKAPDLLGHRDPLVEDLASSDTVVTGTDLAELVGVHPRTIRDLAERGIVERVTTDRYRLAASIKGYTTHLRDMASGRGDEHAQMTLTGERARLAKEQADAVELKNAQLRRELVSAEALTREWAEVLRSIRSKVMSVPERVRQSLAHLTAQDVATIDEELRRALEELADDR